MHPNQIVKTFDRFDLQIVRQRNFSPPAGNWQRNFEVAIFVRVDPGAIGDKL
jgi:hypothetical protein